MNPTNDLPQLPCQADGAMIAHIPGFPGYAVSSSGLVWSCRPINGVGSFGHWRLLRFGKGRGGYLQVVLCLGHGRKCTRRVARLVLATFVGGCPAGLEACHNNGVRTDNRLSNLRYDTAKANHADRRRHGTDCRGERHWHAILTNTQVQAIRSEYMRYSRFHSAAALARKYGVARSTISLVLGGFSWKHIGEAV